MKKFLLTSATAFALCMATTSALAQTGNRISCETGNKVPNTKIGDYLYYKIDFENSSNVIANDIDVKTVFDASKFDLSSLQVVSSSLQSVNPNLQEPAQLYVNGDVATVSFRKGGLGGPGGHGAVLFKIKTKSDLPDNAIVNVSATVKMDNSAITKYTNVEQTLFSDGLSTNIDASIKAYPIPAEYNVTVSCDSTILTVAMLDANNQVMETQTVNDPSSSLDVSTKLDGVYYIRVTSTNGEKVIRIVKD